MDLRADGPVFIKMFQHAIQPLKARREVAVLRRFMDLQLSEHPNVVDLVEVTDSTVS